MKTQRSAFCSSKSVIFWICLMNTSSSVHLKSAFLMIRQTFFYSIPAEETAKFKFYCFPSFTVLTINAISYINQRVEGLSFSKLFKLDAPFYYYVWPLEIHPLTVLQMIHLFYNSSRKNQKDKESLTPLPGVMEKVIC